MPSRTRPQESHTPQVDLKFSIPAGKDNLPPLASTTSLPSGVICMDLKLAASVPYSSPVLLDRPRQSGSEEAAPLAWRALRLVSTGRRKGHPSLTLPRRSLHPHA